MLWPISGNTMSVLSGADLLIHVQLLALARDEPGYSLEDHFADRKVLDLASARLRLRPPEPRSLMRTLQNIDAVRLAARIEPDDANG